MRTLELGEECAGSGEDSHVETVAVRVADKDVASVRYVNAVGEVGDGLVADASQIIALFIEHGHAVAL